MMETKKFRFNNEIVEFEIDNKNVMVNATEMAKIFGKQVVKFMQTDETQNFIQACLKSAKSHFLNIEKEEDLYVSRQKSGTWMHRILALKFAAWLNPDFEVWVYSTIDELLFGTFKEDEETLKKIAGIQDKITEKENELKKLPVLKEIEDLRKSEQREKRRFELRKKMRISGFRTIFSDVEMDGSEKKDD